MDNLPDCQYEYKPEEPTLRIVDVCMDCGNFIMEHEQYYDIKGMVFCENCMDEYKKVGEIDD